MTRLPVVLAVLSSRLVPFAEATEPQSVDAGVTMAARAPPIPDTGKTVEDFVPNGYRIFDRAEADFDGDGQPDVALGLEVENAEGDEDDSPRVPTPRPLIILFHQPDGSYRLSARSDGAIYTGPPAVNQQFSGIRVKDRSIVLGSGAVVREGAVGFEDTDVYRFQGRDWYLVERHQTDWNREEGHDCPGVVPRPSEVCIRFTRSVDFDASVEEVRAELVPGKPDDHNAPRRTVTRRRAIRAAPLRRLDEVFPPGHPLPSPR
ncbi:MAG TPA: hypothetical protein VGG91_08690 [Myxococcaceae bacterium]